MPRMILKWLEAWACAFGVIFLGLFAAGSAGSSPGHLSFGIGNLFAVDPATAVALPGGQRVSFRLKFMSEFKPVAGLSSAAWGKMVEAVRSDFARTGDQVDAWKTVQALEAQPSVTRPEKALRDHSHDLGTGIVALPAQGREAILIASSMADGDGSRSTGAPTALSSWARICLAAAATRSPTNAPTTWPRLILSRATAASTFRCGRPQVVPTATSSSSSWSSGHASR